MASSASPELLEKARLGTLSVIGIDETGKGDYFGPLVTAACFLNPAAFAALGNLEIKESKKISDGRAKSLASEIKKHCPHSVVKINPSKYNELYGKFGNLNKLLAWGHSRALENVLAELKEPVELVISDKFANEWRLEKALLPGGREMKLVQFPKAEEYPAVACASVLARAAFLYALDDLSEEIGWKLHKGAGEPTDAIARGIYKEKGEAGLRSVAKWHFKNTQKIVGRML
ncbi:MAG: ribonuclease HIII [candidate division Zixibacteria bacterium]|nr:ribonuclease HIII [candidate division Zixibacteria bacterium]